jgi:hypothetical protein
MNAKFFGAHLRSEKYRGNPGFNDALLCQNDTSNLSCVDCYRLHLQVSFTENASSITCN